MITIMLITIINNNNNKILNGKASESAGSQKFIMNKNVMLAPFVTPSIHCSVLSVYFDC